MNRQFEHEGKTFEIRETVSNERYVVKIFLDDKQVSPEYSATLEVGQDYFSQHEKYIVDVLTKIAEESIRNGICLKA